MKKIIKSTKLLLIAAFLVSFSSANATNTLIIGFFNGLGDDVTFGAPTNAVCIDGCSDDAIDYNTSPASSPTCNSTVTISKNGTGRAFSIIASEHIDGCRLDSDPSSFTAVATIADGIQLSFQFTFSKETDQWSISGPKTIGGSWDNTPIIYDGPSKNSCSNEPSMLAGSAVNDAGACVNIYLGYNPSSESTVKREDKAPKEHDEEHKAEKKIK